MEPITAIVGLANTILNKIWGNKDDELKRQFILELQTRLAELDIAKAQVQVNMEEAKHESKWVSGWRPFVGWVCGCSFAWQFLLQPIITYIAVMSGFPAPQLPVFDFYALNTVLMGMLGLGALRTYEKVKNKQ